jgi:rhamnose transport system permease protein
VSNAGGIGTAVGALLGAILIDLLENSLIRWLEISEFWRDALLGLLILLAVAADRVIMNRLRNLWARRSQVQASSEPGQVGTQEGGSHVR